MTGLAYRLQIRTHTEPVWHIITTGYWDTLGLLVSPTGLFGLRSEQYLNTITEIFIAWVGNLCILQHSTETTVKKKKTK